jgi:hypothetical protein
MKLVRYDFDLIVHKPKDGYGCAMGVHRKNIEKIGAESVPGLAGEVICSMKISALLLSVLLPSGCGSQGPIPRFTTNTAIQYKQTTHIVGNLPEGTLSWDKNILRLSKFEQFIR